MNISIVDNLAKDIGYPHIRVYPLFFFKVLGIDHYYGLTLFSKIIYLKFKRG